MRFQIQKKALSGTGREGASGDARGRRSDDDRSGLGGVEAEVGFRQWTSQKGSVNRGYERVFWGQGGAALR